MFQGADSRQNGGLDAFGVQGALGLWPRGGLGPDGPRGARPSAAEETAELRYDGFCRDRGLEPGPDVGTRVRLDPGVETFDDGMLGPQRQEPLAQCGDLLVRDRRGNWTYQFAVTVDDLVEQITDVIRGRDLLASTGRQIQLARLLGRATPPAFVHHPLVLGVDGEKLSKSRGDTALRELRAAGVEPRTSGRPRASRIRICVILNPQSAIRNPQSAM